MTFKGGARSSPAARRRPSQAPSAHPDQAHPLGQGCPSSPRAEPSGGPTRKRRGPAGPRTRKRCFPATPLVRSASDIKFFNGFRVISLSRAAFAFEFASELHCTRLRIALHSASDCTAFAFESHGVRLLGRSLRAGQNAWAGGTRTADPRSRWGGGPRRRAGGRCTATRSVRAQSVQEP